jgi:IS5 family transposase
LYFYRAYEERKSKKEHLRGESINKAEKVYNSKKLHKTKNKRRLVSRVIGGRNRFKKSPRRKTLRKTRKLK